MPRTLCLIDIEIKLNMIVFFSVSHCSNGMNSFVVIKSKV